jgi:hypothetical protein
VSRPARAGECCRASCCNQRQFYWDNGGTGFDLASTDLVATGYLATRNQIGFALNAPAIVHLAPA